MKKSSDIADKIYKILFNKCDQEFEGKSWREWHVALRNQQIESKGFDNTYDQIEELMLIINNRSDEFVVCPDPWVSVNEQYGHEGFLIIPVQIAEKIVVLQGLP